MNKHSCGPWEIKVIQRDEHGRPVRTNVNSRSWEGLALVYATEGGTPEQQEEAEANARLIAAAPELLKACQYVLLGWVGNTACSFDVQPVVAAINKAISGTACQEPSNPKGINPARCMFISDIDG